MKPERRAPNDEPHMPVYQGICGEKPEPEAGSKKKLCKAKLPPNIPINIPGKVGSTLG
jgi:hypothetical protein